MEKPVKKTAVRKPRATSSTTTSASRATAKPRAAAGTAARSSRTDAPALDHASIAARAYDLFQRAGHAHGRDVEFWLEAERELKQKLKT